ncbi:transient receptor potential cation channel protein painless-like, partial [Temnothorax curvispinosus]|uniref:Transient receptor potential cation channel protein painless-like n=1 Tax=Temnothorax curvispinosus TaxID=300111 RepID=A0A6J1R171_9HYME
MLYDESNFTNTSGSNPGSNDPKSGLSYVELVFIWMAGVFIIAVCIRCLWYRLVWMLSYCVPVRFRPRRRLVPTSNHRSQRFAEDGHLPIIRRFSRSSTGSSSSSSSSSSFANFFRIMQGSSVSNLDIREILRRSIQSPARLNIIKEEVLLYGHDIVFRELLNLQPEINGTMILEACRLLEISSLENASNQLEYIKLMEFRETMDVRSVDGLGNTPLHYALERNYYEAAILLLKEGSYLGQVNESNNIVIANIPEFILSSYFNDCIQLKKEWTDECTIEFDYRCLMPHENFNEQQEISRATCEMEVILYIANNDTLKHLLRHPLISSFLYIKWYMIRNVLYVNFVFYTMFYFFVNAYILSMTYDISSRNTTQQVANDSSNTVYASTFLTLQNNLSWVFVMGMLLPFTYREILQFYSCPKRYLVDLENWSQVLLMVLTLALLCGAGRQIGVMVILLSTWELMTLISHHLFPSTCIEMFRTVFFNFVRFFFPYLILIFAFTLAFYMLLRNDDFSNPGFSLFKTIIMFTGEFDAKGISFSAYPVWSRIVFVLFIFHIVIVLFNLLNGLAISNIAEILNKAEIMGLISR